MTYVNPLVESGEYERVYAGDIEPGAILAAYGDARVSWVTPYPGERVSFGLVDVPGGATYRRDSVLLVKVGSQA